MANLLTARVAAFSLGALLLGACGADSPEDLAIAVQSAADTLDYPEGEEAACIGNSIFTEVGYDQLVADSHTISSLQLDPSGSIASLLETYASDTLDTSIVDCLDVDSRFRSELARQHLTAGITCQTEFGVESPVVKAHIDSVISGTDTSITIADTEELRDLLRPCASEDDFATAFGLKTSAELADVIDDELGTKLRRDKQPCAGPVIVEMVGFEALNEYPLGVDGKRLDFDELGIDDDQRSTLISAVAQCSDFVERARDDYRTAEPFFGPCAVDALKDDEDWLNPSVELALGLRSSRRSIERAESFVLDDCVETQIEESFGPVDAALRVSAFDYASGLFRGTSTLMEEYGPTEAEYKCMAYGLYHEIGLQEVLTASAILIEDKIETIEYWEAYDQLWGTLGRAGQACFGDWMVVSGDVHRAGFSEETLNCLRDELEEFGEIETYANLLNADTAPLSDDEYWDLVDLLDGWYLAFTSGLEDCYVDGENMIFDDYIAWLNSAGSDGDLVTT